MYATIAHIYESIATNKEKKTAFEKFFQTLFLLNITMLAVYFNST